MRKPNARHYMKSMFEKYGDYYSPYSISIQVSKAVDKQWDNYCIKKILELSQRLGYKPYWRKDLSNYRIRKIKKEKIRIGKRTIYFLPLTENETDSPLKKEESNPLLTQSLKIIK